MVLGVLGRRADQVGPCRPGERGGGAGARLLFFFFFLAFCVRGRVRRATWDARTRRAPQTSGETPTARTTRPPRAHDTRHVRTVASPPPHARPSTRP
ncbi:hypothetical protein B0H16DRAFT_1586364 [Mycena metata]|uniref:Uncharacterized protein n=1 Tax=Mycena metata TaxID=1033252 RepID=A0AAD7HY87_9AGAR|nr:hypothetical protein B0H16DRAFT_1586364 [Mycena metata]